MSESWRDWLAQQRANATMETNLVPLAELSELGAGGAKIAISGWLWSTVPGGGAAQQILAHAKGAFFKIWGVKITTKAREVVTWNQPMIKEEGRGVVGLIVTGVAHRFLVAAREEPGNPGAKKHILLGPPLQASKSNLEAAHGGKLPPRAEFLKAGAEWFPQPQDGGRFYEKETDLVIIQLPEQDFHAITPLPNERVFTRVELREALSRGECNPYLAQLLAHLLT